MLTTADASLAALARSLRDHGASRSDHARHHASAAFLLADYDRVGFNFRLTDIQAAVGSVQMDRAAWIGQERARVAAQYDAALTRFTWLSPPTTPAGYQHGYQAYVCLFRPEEPTLANVDRLHDWRNRLMLRLEERGVSTRQGTHAPVLQNFYRDKYRLTAAAFPQSTIADRLSLTLPLFPGMTGEEQSYVIDELGVAFEATR